MNAAVKLLLGALFVAGSAQAQYPDRPITWVVPFAAGAGGTVGAAKVAKARPDGYTFLVGHVGYMAAAPSLYKQLSYDPVKDFEAVVRFPDTPMVLVCGRNHRLGNVRSLIDFARANPGKLNFGNAGVGSAGHLTAAMFASEARAQLTHVAYKGNAPAVTDIMGGSIDCMFDQSNTALPHVRGEKVSAFATTSKERIPQMPQVPTLAESGLAGFEAATWYGIYAPKGTPREAIQHAVAQFQDAMNDTAFMSKLVEGGYVMIPADQRGPEALATHTRSEVERWKKVVNDAGIPPN